MSEHIVKAYGEELNHLSAEVARMGGLAEAEVADAIETVTRRDLTLAQSVIERYGLGRELIGSLDWE